MEPAKGSSRLRVARSGRLAPPLTRPFAREDTRLGWVGTGAAGTRAVGWLGPLLLVLAGCVSTNPDRERGEEALARGDYETALWHYGEALKREPDDADLVHRAVEVRGQAVGARAAQTERALEEGRLEEAEQALAALVRLGPEGAAAARPLRARLEPELDRARHERELAEAAFRGGDAITAWEILERDQAARGLTKPGGPGFVDKVRLTAAQALRQRAAERIRAGEVEAGSADLARAQQLESFQPGGSRATPVASGPTTTPMTTPPAAGRPGEAAPEPRGALASAGALEDYAEAARTIERLTEGLPRRRPGGGLAEPEDYAIEEAELAALRQAVDTALRLRPQGESQPRWLGRGRLVVQFSNEVHARRRLDEASRLIAQGDIGQGLGRADSVRGLHEDILDDPEVAARHAAVRRGAALALVESAERAVERGLVHLARLRAEQARETSADVAPRAVAVLERARLSTRSPAVVLFPFQDYTDRGGIGARLVDALRRDLDGRGIGPLVTFQEYSEAKRAGALPPLAGVLRGDVLRFQAREVEDERAAIGRQVEVLEERLRDARRRVTATPDRAARLVALQEVDDLERELARTRRRQSAALLAPPGAAPERQVVIALEVRYGMYAGEGGAPISEEVVTRTRTGPASGATAEEDALFAEVVGRLGEVVSQRLAQSTQGVDPSALGDALSRLDAQIAMLSRRGAVPGRDQAIADVVAQTGYSFALGKTIPERIVLRGP